MLTISIPPMNTYNQELNADVNSCPLRVHRYISPLPGPRLIVLGAVHGNETCGTEAIERVIRNIDAGALAIKSGSVTFVPICNPKAYALQRRQCDRNLNRNLVPTDNPIDYEDTIANVLCPLLEEHDVLLDLHSFHTAGEPFGVIGSKEGRSEKLWALEENLMLCLGANRVLEGWMEAYAKGVQRRRISNPEHAHMHRETYGIGTTEFMRLKNRYGITLECGQHSDFAAPAFAYQAIKQTMALLNIADIERAEQPDSIEVVRLVDVVDKSHDDDTFVKVWRNFDSVSAGEEIGRRANGEVVRANNAGLIVFPNPLALAGNEWFYFAVLSERQLAKSNVCALEAI